ncbi:MAG: tripartite tricarboxylate transporter TctB family protein [Alphaproteobacteria bacterium]|nr:tripartite tricarboxylate transporter TctB family protein [Alphaproteobacteria bacterium]
MRPSRDDVLGLGMIAAAAAYWAAADRISVSLLADAVGADGVPKMLAVALAVLGALLIVATRIKAAPAEPRTPETDEQLRAHVRAAGLFGGLAAYALLLPVLGYPLALALLIGGSAVYGGAQVKPSLALIASLGGLGFWLFFAKGLGILMPLGAWVPGS